MGRIVTLLVASRRIPESFLADQLAAAVRGETASRILLVHLGASDAGVSLKTWSSHRAAWQDDFALAGQVRAMPAGYGKLSLAVSNEPLERNHLAGFIGHCGLHFGIVLLQVDADLPARLLVECLSRSELSMVFLNPDSDSRARFSQLSRDTREVNRVTSPSLKPVLCIEGESVPHEVAAQTSRDLAVTNLALLRGMQTPPQPDRLSPEFGSDLRRLAREIGRCRVGLALSAGAAKGLAHVGVLQVLEENGIEVDMVAGTSMGAYVGSLWAFGHSVSFLEEKARELERPGNLWSLIDPVLPPRQGFMRGEGVKRRLMRSIGDVQFAGLARPFRVVATNLETLERSVFSAGEVATAVHASCAIPGACVPVELNGELYIDGGVSDPVPVDVLREAGIEKVIAVNVIPTPAVLRCSREKAREQAEVNARGWSPLRYLNHQMNYFADGNILDIIQRSILGAQIRNAEEACRAADVVLRPVACDAFWHDFKSASRYLALGRRVTVEQLDGIRALVRRPQHIQIHEPDAHGQPVAAAA